MGNIKPIIEESFGANRMVFKTSSDMEEWLRQNEFRSTDFGAENDIVGAAKISDTSIIIYPL